MKSLANGLIAFVVSLSIGTVASWVLLKRPTPVNVVYERAELPGPTAPAFEKKVAFTTEFTQLPEYEELDFPELPDNFIDLYNTDGLLRKSEVLAKTGEKWLLLSETSGKYRIKTAKAKVKQLKSTSYPGDENDARLSFAGSGTPVFAVRKIAGIKPGPVQTLYLRPTWEEMNRRDLPIKAMETGFKREFNLNDNWSTLRVSNATTKTGEKIGVLVLENGDIQQVIARNYYDDAYGTIIGELLWAGDMDNDGKLDLYVDEFNEKGYFHGTLFLSSHAKKGELVGIAASFGYAGC